MDLVIRNVRLIDGTGAAPVPQVSVDVFLMHRPVGSARKPRDPTGRCIKKTSTARV